MKKVLKKSLIIMLVFTLIVTSVTHYKTQEVKGAITFGLTTAEIIALVLGGSATVALTSNGQEITEANFKVTWNDMLRTVMPAGMAGSAEILADSVTYCNQAWSAYEQEGLPWDLPVGGIEGNPTRREIWSETWDSNPADFELFKQTVNNNNPTEPPENDSGKFVLKLLAGTLGFSALVGMAGYLGEDIGTFFENTEVPDTSNIIDSNTGEYLVQDGKPVVNEFTWKENTLTDARINVNFLQNYPRYQYQYEYRYKANGAIGYFINDGILYLRTLDKNGGEFEEYVTCSSRGLNHSLQRQLYNSFPNVSTWKGLDTVSDWSMYSNIPLFENKEKYDMFLAGEIGIDNALNYTEPTIEQQQLKEIIEAFNDLLDEMENEGVDKPYDNIQQAMQDYIQDMVTDIQEQITPDTTPEDVVDDIQDRLIDDIDTILPVQSPIPPITEPTEPNPPIPPSDDVTLGGVLSTAFPFCIPFDLIYLIKALKATPEPPRWVFPIEISKLNIHEEIVIDFAQFETVAEVCRICFTILFIFGLIMATRKLIKG